MRLNVVFEGGLGFRLHLLLDADQLVVPLHPELEPLAFPAPPLFQPELELLLAMAILGTLVLHPGDLGCTTLTNCSKYLPGFLAGMFEKGMVVGVVAVVGDFVGV